MHSAPTLVNPASTPINPASTPVIPAQAGIHKPLFPFPHRHPVIPAPHSVIPAELVLDPDRGVGIHVSDNPDIQIQPHRISLFY